MARFVSPASLLAILALGLCTTSVHAEMIYWSYQSGAFPDRISQRDGYPVSAGDGRGMDFNGRSSTNPLLGSANIPLLDLAPFSDYGHPFRVGPTFQNVHFDLNVRLRDEASKHWGNLDFLAAVNGRADHLTQTSTVTLTFVGSPNQSLLIGQNRYSVTIDPLQPLAWHLIRIGHFQGDTYPLGYFTGTLDGSVNVSAASPAATPEPSCLILAGMGLVTVAGAAWRKRRGKMVS